MEKHISNTFFSDIVSGSIAGAAVAPIISAVDRALAENASGKAPLWTSFASSLKSMVKSPIQFIKSPQFYWIWIVYGGTYVAVNLTSSACEYTRTDPALPKWAASFSFNTTSCIAKDRAFAVLFGTRAASSVPLGSYGAWLGRDFISMAFFFTLPPIVGKQLAQFTGSDKSGYYVAQFGLPLVLQTVTTPVHLLGYDIYNNPSNTVKQRIAFMARDYWKNVTIRMVRMAPPWSIGTIGNQELRSYLRRE